MTQKHLDVVLRYMTRKEHTHRDNVPIIIADYYTQNPDCSLGEFAKFIRSIRSDFFRINRIDRYSFAEEVHQILVKIPIASRNLSREDALIKGKLDALLEASEQAQEDHRSFEKKLDETYELVSREMMAQVEGIIRILTELDLENRELASLESSEVFRSLKQRLILNKQEKQIDLMERMNRKLSRLLVEVQKDKSKAQRILSGIKEFGISVTSEVLATVLLKMIGFNSY